MVPSVGLVLNTIVAFNQTLSTEINGLIYLRRQLICYRQFSSSLWKLHFWTKVYLASLSFFLYCILSVEFLVGRKSKMNPLFVQSIIDCYSIHPRLLHGYYHSIDQYNSKVSGYCWLWIFICVFIRRKISIFFTFFNQAKRSILVINWQCVVDNGDQSVETFSTILRMKSTYGNS